MICREFLQGEEEIKQLKEKQRALREQRDVSSLLSCYFKIIPLLTLQGNRVLPLRVMGKYLISFIMSKFLVRNRHLNLKLTGMNRINFP